MGKVCHTGVSNFNRFLLEQAIELSTAPPRHKPVRIPSVPQPVADRPRDAEGGPCVTTYCAMAVGRVLGDPTLSEIATSHGRSIPRVVLRWLIQQGNVVAVSRTSNPDRIAEDLAIFDFELGEDEMAAIQSRVIAAAIALPLLSSVNYAETESLIAKSPLLAGLFCYNRGYFL